MFVKARQFVMRRLGAKSGTGVMVGSYITPQGVHGVSIALADGWGETKARLSPAGARRIADSLRTWASAAEQNNQVGQWQAVVRYAAKEGVGDLSAETPPAAQAT